MSKISAVIAAGGKGARMGAGENKVFMPLCGEAILLHTLRAFEGCEVIDEIVIVSGAGEHRKMARLASDAGITKMKAVTEGGATRRESVKNGIAFTSGDIIMIHDAARALITDGEIRAAAADAEKYGAAALGVKVKDTLKSADENGFITGTVDREATYRIQTPQAFRRDIITAAHNAADEHGWDATDDCALVERLGIRIKITPGSYDNIKLTTPDDMASAEIILKRRNEK